MMYNDILGFLTFSMNYQLKRDQMNYLNFMSYVSLRVWLSSLCYIIIAL